jgi:transposase
MTEVVNFEQIVERGCGLDVHKKTVVATIDGSGLKQATREFSTTTRSLTELREWLKSAKITHVVMESTGVYWKPVYHVLEPSGIFVWIVNARHVKYVPGHKTDKRDSKWLCKLLLAGLLKPSYIPPREQRELRDLTRYRRKLIEQIASEKNRIIRILEDCNIKLSSVLSDTQVVVGTKLIDKLCKNGKLNMADIEEVYHGKLQASKEEIYEACEGVVTEHHVFLLQAIKKDICSCESIIATLTERIKEMLSPYDNVLELLKEVPGLSTKSVEDLIAEIGLDMSAFPTEKHLSSWAGVSPGNHESAGKKKSGRTTHGNKQVKAVITEVAWAATRTKNTFYSARYHRLAARRGKKRALIAVGHSILKSVYHILSGKEHYRELGADYLNNKIEAKRKAYLKKELEKMGYKVELNSLPKTG